MSNPTATSPPQPWTAPTASDPVAATLRLPGSKSMTARALVLGALAGGPSTLARPLRARDTELMAGGLRALGAHMSISDDDRWLVRPYPLAGPAHVDVGLAGTVMRFLPPVAGLAAGRVTFDGDPHARTRPLGPLIGALRTLGVRIDAPAAGSLPLVVLGAGRVTGGDVVIDASASSQLVSGLLLAAPRFDRGVVVRHEGPPVPSAPHLRMTVQMLRAAGAAVDDTTPDVWTVEPGPLSGRGWEIEPDLSGAAPFFAAALVTGGEVTLQGWPRSSLQPVEQLRELLHRMGGEVSLGTDGLTVRGTGTVRGLDADLSDVGELTPVLTALTLLADGPSRLTGIGHIRGHETDRVTALAKEFTALGADITETRDGLDIRPRPLRGGTFRTYADHRMAHAAAVAGLAVPGIEVDDVACTSKTMPEFPALWSGMVTGKN
ncbi:3-phosphoshikimate 1-carboxyvinyltransferase [Micromonospora sp. WMMD718]|uniref:3-phosphoshikimate 1-carboxyvinyltransferase n=1 Tax=Micromonospora aurantiaca (nom. illeg.) TaxID=47850 RepID=A0ABQ6UGI1_9ACTN|nr:MULTISPECIES: 3-phosphoshikimate 1-carboxyvinyltransferase [Micromonospora]KAB1113220.1 3-phosphoshikimate 1-carboxyvinyltransferase [Micromonospora aurantiaca]MDG4754063.1 3-phosphoshikimate 1-carboxyvinyltransferase [Micromonospora sp. WMMD718]OHX05860.1 3-phosphoshikimate 1-carboxyvinyltransferase [Micromonospora sp. WMMB235]UFN93741.1 3-phosphoshikimate 1-carboxyvinyltransferase [Micromonospora aurantiaca]SCL41604.1 3-phosphoshikimate 1-carboxyvinyltransferase [Micromonospora aurantiaca